MTCVVRIPKKNRRYTLYADGKLIEVLRTEKGTYVTLDDNFPFCLYFTLGKFRRLYVCARSDLFDGDLFSPIEVTSSSDLAIIDVLEGRSFDRFKRCMDYLVRVTSLRVREYPPLFYAQLALMCHLNRADRINLKILVCKYDASVKMEDIKWT